MREDIFAAVLCMLLVLAVCVLTLVPGIHAWEMQNDYPFGKLCELYRNCR